LGKNLLLDIKEQKVAPFNWKNQADFTLLPEGGIRIFAPGKTDFFCNPDGTSVQHSAPYLYLNVTGDFVMKAHVCHPFKHKWDAAVLMVREDANRWAKLCFEGSDFGTQAVVSVVTNNGLSDDANGVNYHWPSVWLQIVRKGNLFGMHYGPDGQTWNMVRYFTLDVPKTIKAGMVAQCPVGQGTYADFMYFSMENRSVDDIRAGI
jgi:regulation of enolase protein 1 (concanavalin A-like superfamily)